MGPECLVRKTICGHIFHQECLDKWCSSKMSCPICRTSLEIDGMNRIERLLNDSEPNLRENILWRLTNDMMYQCWDEESLQSSISIYLFDTHFTQSLAPKSPKGFLTPVDSNDSVGWRQLYKLHHLTAFNAQRLSQHQLHLRISFTLDIEIDRSKARPSRKILKLDGLILFFIFEDGTF